MDSRDVLRRLEANPKIDELVVRPVYCCLSNGEGQGLNVIVFWVDGRVTDFYLPTNRHYGRGTMRKFATVWTVDGEGKKLSPVEINIRPRDVERAQFNHAWSGWNTHVEYTHKPAYETYNDVTDHPGKWGVYERATGYYWMCRNNGDTFQQMAYAAWSQGMEGLGNHYAQQAEIEYARAARCTEVTGNAR